MNRRNIVKVVTVIRQVRISDCSGVGLERIRARRLELNGGRVVFATEMLMRKFVVGVYLTQAPRLFSQAGRASHQGALHPRHREAFLGRGSFGWRQI
jgi:hypothetical protein